MTNPDNAPAALELAACPFCGRPVRLEIGEASAWVECVGAGCDASQMHYTAEAAIPDALWPFIKHNSDCPVNGHWMEAAEKECDCGLAAALSTTPTMSAEDMREAAAKVAEDELARFETQARAAGVREGMEDKWQDIASAPREGTFLVCGAWDHEDEYYHGKTWWQFGHGHQNGPYGDWDEGRYPTHWQPLPEPPAIRAASGETR